ncbi:pentapeptide repeat-containing protein [Bailinhaonella thermotolerans]|uniref:Pentapeptide repeat-containing protein n=1 Tax=Bailinhaonella thermotolerans TaxID=1070861 RepID=A0A3A4BFE4_9ACTN|nr:pentapeptide repeat-containing protein [Bailinhaonella thermotolerans]RJL30062.1 pentapeptide repeat-containing protein [Bailinhaonella thermotolerans]
MVAAAEDGTGRVVRLAAALKGLSREAGGRYVVAGADFAGARIDASGVRGVVFSGAASFAGAEFTGDADFTAVTFQDRADFEGAVFEGAAGFQGAVFEGDAIFRRVRYAAPADFGGAVFKGAARFGGSAFEGPGRFADAEFAAETDFAGTGFAGDADFVGAALGDADFTGTVFSRRAAFVDAAVGPVRFHDTVFGEEADFSGAAFSGYTRFRRTGFRGGARFAGAAFTGDALFEDVRCAGQLRLSRSRWERSAVLGRVEAGEVDLALASFQRLARVELTAETVRFDRTSFPGGARLLVDRAEVWLDDVEFGAASVFGARRDTHVGQVFADRPVLRGVAGTDLANLTVVFCDLSRCSFRGAYNLDRMRVDYMNAFGSSPGRLFARRRTLADEHRFRALHGRPRTRRRWRLAGDSDDDLTAVRGGDVGGDYHALRKGREDEKDEPGAADFYYGEMEIRRLFLRAGLRGALRGREWGRLASTSGDWLLVTLYWLLSGYGLRLWRALTAFAVLVAVAAAAFVGWGFPPGATPSYPDAVRFSLRSAVSLLRGPEAALTPAGEWIELVLRFTAPVLLGLALLAVRARVKR